MPESAYRHLFCYKKALIKMNRYTYLAYLPMVLVSSKLFDVLNRCCEP